MISTIKEWEWKDSNKLEILFDKFNEVVRELDDLKREVERLAKEVGGKGK